MIPLIVIATIISGCYNIMLTGGGGGYGAYPKPDYLDVKLAPENIPWHFPSSDIPAPKFPQAHPDAIYKEGMTPRQYFDHLCKLESGEFITRTVKDVDGIYLLRPRFTPNVVLRIQRTALEDPYGVVEHDGLGYSEFHRWYTMSFEDNPRKRDGRYRPDISYKFTEKPYLEEKDVRGFRSHYEKSAIYDKAADEPERRIFISYNLERYLHEFHDKRLRRATETTGRYFRYVRNWPIEYRLAPSGHHFPQNDYLIERRVDTLKSRYGVAWRGISRPRDREMGIAGAELLIIDLMTNEIIAYRRGFILSGTSDPGFSVWTSSRHYCPAPFLKDDDWPPITAATFIQRVLIPSTSSPD